MSGLRSNQGVNRLPKKLLNIGSSRKTKVQSRGERVLTSRLGQLDKTLYSSLGYPSTVRKSKTTAIESVVKNRRSSHCRESVTRNGF